MVIDKLMLANHIRPLLMKIVQGVDMRNASSTKCILWLSNTLLKALHIPLVLIEHILLTVAAGLRAWPR